MNYRTKTTDDLMILIAWHDESDPAKVACFEENKRTFQDNNPGVDIVVIVSPYGNSKIAWLNSDLTIFQWYNEHKEGLTAKRFLLLEWDSWCDMDMREYFKSVWDLPFVAPSVLYPERDEWYWFKTMGVLPERARLFATGTVPFCGMLLSGEAMRMINAEILKPEYFGLNSELRLPTIATMLGIDPVPNPVCSRSITWKPVAPFDSRVKGIHHPRKLLVPANLLDEVDQLIEKYLLSGDIPKIIHQTWKTKELPEHMAELPETWKEHHPDWDYLLWTDVMNREFIKRYYPGFLLQYDSYAENIQRVDAVRYFVLLKMGGLFIDVDMECLQNIEPLITGAEAIFALEPNEHALQFQKQKIICNAFMAAKAGNDFFNVICNSLASYNHLASNHINTILSTTGPFALTNIYDRYTDKEKVKLLTSDTVYPLTVTETRRIFQDDIDEDLQQKIDKAYAVHYFFGTWYNNMFEEQKTDISKTT